MKAFISHVQYSVIAFGGAGARIIKILNKLGLPAARLHLFDTDRREIEGHGISGRHLLGRNLSKGQGTFSNPDVGRQAYEDAKEFLDRLSNEDHLFIIVGALGGGTFSSMSPLFAETLVSKRRKFIIVTKWPVGEDEVNVGIALKALKLINDFTDNVLLYGGEVVRKEMAQHRKENAYQEINNRISNDIKDLLGHTSNRILEASIPDEIKLHDNFIRIKGYIEGYEWVVGQNDDSLYLSRTNVALLDTIHSGHTQLYSNTPRKFEELTAEIYQRSGWEATLTSATRDQGVDIRLKLVTPLSRPIETVVQTKMKGEGKKIQRPEVQQLVGAREGANADTAIFVSAGNFSTDSIAYAKSQKIDLFRFFDLLEEYKRSFVGKVLRFDKPPGTDIFSDNQPQS